jgi:pentalenene oxygenase
VELEEDGTSFMQADKSLFKRWSLRENPGAILGIGHLHKLYRNPLGFMTSLNGHDGMVKIKLGRQAAYVVSDRDLFDSVLREDRIFDKGGILFEELEKYMGRGLVTCPHAAHRPMRRVTQSNFRQPNIQEYVEGVIQEVEISTRAWKSGQTIDLSSFSLEIFSRTIAKIVFGPDTPNRSLQYIVDAVRSTQEGVFQAICLSFLPRYVSARLNRKFLSAQMAMRAALSEDLADQYQSERKGLVAIWSNAKTASGEPLYSQEEVFGQCLNLLFAGAETVASTLPWVLLHILENSSVRRQIEAEINAHPFHAKLQYDAASFPHLRRTVAETLRLTPPVWILTRKTTCAVELLNGTIPADALIIISPYALQRKHSTYSSPDSFEPARWESAGQLGGSFNGVLTFGAGPRRCIGDALAMAELTIATAIILRTWKLTIGSRPIPRVRATISPRSMLVRVERRLAAA